MITPKLRYVVVILWLVLPDLTVKVEGQLNVFYATTNVLIPPCSYQACLVIKHVTLLSVLLIKYYTD